MLLKVLKNLRDTFETHPLRSIWEHLKCYLLKGMKILEVKHCTIENLELFAMELSTHQL